MRFDKHSSRVLFAATIATAVVGALALPAFASTAPRLGFASPLRLGTWAGGEPSIAFDPTGNGAVYVTAPQSGPAVAEDAIAVLNTAAGVKPGQVTAGDKGVGFWASFDGGHSFRRNADIGTGLGGFDSDVAVTPDHKVYVADLEAAAAAICTSSDKGATWASGPVPVADCKSLALNHQGPENDREWLTPGRNGEMYLTYHDLAFGFPIILKSTDGASTFLPCGSILNPTQDAGKNYQPLNGTLVAKPVVDRDGSIYVTVTEPDLVAPPVGATLNHVFLASTHGPCSATTLFDSHTVYTDPGAAFTLFQTLGIDGSGTLYIAAAGKTAASQTTNNIWLFTSRDHGVHWSKPVRVNAPSLKANVMPAIVGGLGANEVALGWFGSSTNADPNFAKDQWRYYVATSFDGGNSFESTTVTRNPVHFGDICTDGVFCGLVPGAGVNRNLADFSSIAVNPATGCVTVAFPGDPWNRPDVDANNNDFQSAAYVATQSTGRCLSSSNARVLGRSVTRTTTVSGAHHTNAGALPSTGAEDGAFGLAFIAAAAALVTRLRSANR